jgi:hypothetical protein
VATRRGNPLKWALDIYNPDLRRFRRCPIDSPVGMPQWLGWQVSNRFLTVRIFQKPSFGDFWQPSANVRPAAQMRKYSGFTCSEFPRDSDRPFETYCTLLSSATSLSEYATSGWTCPPKSLFKVYNTFLRSCTFTPTLSFKPTNKVLVPSQS